MISNQPNRPASDPSQSNTSASSEDKPESAGLPRKSFAASDRHFLAASDEKHVVLYRASNFFVATVARAGITASPFRRRCGQTTMTSAYAQQHGARMVDSETRMLPKVEQLNPIHAGRIPFPAWAEAIVMGIGLIVAGVAHAYNMFNYPQYSLDEGTYISSAWAIVHGMLAPYPYGYGHPPLGWIQIAAWVEMTGGFFTFGNATNTGRVLMLFFAVGSALLVYVIMRRLHGSRAAALLAMVIFSLSPLCIAYQRLVLLDNIATFWLLLSLYFIVISKSRLLFIVLAAIAFGISLLSKEVMLLFLPGMIYGVWLHTTKFQRKFALVAFIYCIAALGSTFVLMAILRGELLPPLSWLPGDTNPHLSLFSTYVTQVQRGQTQGSLGLSLTTWDGKDLLFIMLALAAPLFNLVAGWWDRKILLVALLTLSFWLLFVRNGVVFDFYIIPLLPLSAFNIAIACNTLLRWLYQGIRSLIFRARKERMLRQARRASSGNQRGRDFVRVALLGVILIAIATYDLQHSAEVYQANLTGVQTEALTWIRDNVPRNAVVVINSYFYTDLHQQGGEGVGNGAIFSHADIYWNVAYDPELHDVLLDNNWDNIDYIVADAPMLYDIEHLGGEMDLIDEALHHAILRVNFQPTRSDTQDAIWVYQVIHKHASSFNYTGSTTKAWNGSIYFQPVLDKKDIFLW